MFPYILANARRTRRASCRAAFALSFLLAFVLPPAHGQALLDLDEAVGVAESRSRQLLADDAAGAASRAMAASAGALPDPVLRAGVNNLPVDGADRFSLTRDFMTMRSIGVAQELTRSDKRRARSVRFEREADLAQAARSLALFELRRETALAWLALHFQERLSDLLQEQRAETGLQVEAAETAFAGRRGTQAEVLAALAAMAEIEDRRQDVESRIGIARVRLARWIGTASDRPLGPLPPLDLAWLDIWDVNAVVDRHPRLVMMMREEDVARAEVAMARSGKQADWSVELTYSQRGPAYSNMASIGVSVPLQVDPGNRQDQEIAAKLGLADRIREQQEEARRALAGEIRSDVLRLRSLRDRIDRFDRYQGRIAAERSAAEVASYRGGGSSLASALAARRLGIEARLERLRMETEAAETWARLAYLRKSAIEE